MENDLEVLFCARMRKRWLAYRVEEGGAVGWYAVSPMGRSRTHLTTIAARELRRPVGFVVGELVGGAVQPVGPFRTSEEHRFDQPLEPELLERINERRGRQEERAT